MNKIIALLLITISSTLILSPIGVSAKWKSDNKGWWYTEGNSWATGWRLIDTNWYYFYSDGYMAKDITINGYYLNSNGVWSNSEMIVKEAQAYLNEMSEQHKKEKYANCTDTDILNILMSDLYYFGKCEPE